MESSDLKKRFFEKAWIEKLSQFRKYEISKFFLPNKPVNYRFFDEADKNSKYLSLHGNGTYWKCYEEALRDELIGLGMLMPAKSK